MIELKFITYRDKEIPIASSTTGELKTTSKDPIAKKKAKFQRMARIASNLPEIEKKLWNIINSKKNDAKFAYSVLLMINTGIRSGNEGSAEGYICNIKNHELFGQTIQTYGITTLKKEHIEFKNDKLIIEFLGKKAVEQNIQINDPDLVKWGQYFYNNSKTDLWLDIKKNELSEFIKSKIGKKYSIKDFRTVKANLTAGTKAVELNTPEKPTSKKDVTQEVKTIVETVSEQLGNTPSIAKGAYINPEILEWFIYNRHPKMYADMKKKEEEKIKLQNKLNKDKNYIMYMERVNEILPQVINQPEHPLKQELKEIREKIKELKIKYTPKKKKKEKKK